MTTDTDSLQCAKTEAKFLQTIIIGDQSWVYDYTFKTKAQSPAWIPQS